MRILCGKILVINLNKLTKMKKILSFLFILSSILIGCNDDYLPKASFDLYENSLLKAIPGDMEVALNWEEASTGKPDGFFLTWTSQNDPNGGEMSFGANEKNTVVTNLMNDVEYIFSIQSIYGDRKSGKISTKVKPITSRYIVENLVAAAGDQRVKLQWKKPNSDKLTGYKITVNPGGQEYTLSDPNLESYVISGLTNDQEYDFKVISIYTNGESETTSVKATPGIVIPILVAKNYYLPNQTINFTYNEMYFIGGDIQSVLWNFGDGSTSTDKNAQHAYTKGGEYDVNIDVTYTDNTKESKSMKIYVIEMIWNYTLKNSNGSNGQIKTSNPVFSPDGKTIYIPSAGGVGDLHAINTIDGTSKWIFPIPNITYGGGPSIGKDGTIYQGAQDSKVYAINPDGSKKWEYNAGGRVEAFVAVSSQNDVFALSNTNLVLHAISADGSAKWTKTLVGNPGAVAVIGSKVYAGTSSNIYCFDMTGNELWKTPANVTERGAFASGNGTLYSVQKGGAGLIALDLNSGAEKWTYKNISGDAYGPIVGKDGTIYFTDKGGKSLYAVNNDGSEKWVFTTKYQLTYSLASLDENGIVYFSTFNQDAECAFYAVDSKDGSELWKITKSGSSDAEKGMAGVTVGPDKKLYVSTIAGGLSAIPIYAGPELNSWSSRGGNPQGTSSK